MLSFLVSTPSVATENVLVFLHGVGEAFIPLERTEDLYSANADEAAKKAPGFDNLLNHGVPKILKKPGEVLSHDARAKVGSPPFTHPIFQSFITIAPQAFLREDLADAEKNHKMLDRVVAIAKAVTHKPKIAVMGFSRGGYAALELGARPDVEVVVTMDAVAKGPRRDLNPAFDAHRKPTWAFYAGYPKESGRKERITAAHEGLAVTPVEDFSKPPKEAHCKTLVPTSGSEGDRHNQVCNVVCNSPVVYEWILRQLRPH